MAKQSPSRIQLFQVDQSTWPIGFRLNDFPFGPRRSNERGGVKV